MAIFTGSKSLPGLDCVHVFEDDFIVVRPKAAVGEIPWLAIDQRSSAGGLIAKWMRRIDPGHPVAEFDSFDLIINLVALGLGKAIVPRRAVRGCGQRIRVEEEDPPERLKRTVGVYRKKAATPNPALDRFVESILFGWKNPSGRDGERKA